MPIKINLLAEEQAAEELRRKDPLKRAIVIAGIVVALVIVWAGFNTIRVGKSTARADAIRAEYEAVEGQEKELKEMRAWTGRLEGNLMNLHRLATNRFLTASVLNELQFDVIEGIQLTQFEIRQNFLEYEGTPASKSGETKAIPARSVEQVMFRIYAQDSADKFNEYMAKIAESFDGKLRKRDGVSLQNRSDPVLLPDKSASYRAIVIECRYPDVEREP